MNYRSHHWGVIGLVLLALSLGVTGGVVIGCKLLDASPPPSTLSAVAEPDFHLMAEAWDTIQRSYVDPKAVNPRLMTYGAISGMVDALGDTGHSRFLSPEMAH